MQACHPARSNRAPAGNGRWTPRSRCVLEASCVVYDTRTLTYDEVVAKFQPTERRHAADFWRDFAWESVVGHGKGESVRRMPLF